MAEVWMRARSSANIKCLRLALERVESGRDVFSSPDLDRGDLEAERTSRRLRLAHFQRGSRITDISHNRQTAETGDITAPLMRHRSIRRSVADARCRSLARRPHPRRRGFCGRSGKALD